MHTTADDPTRYRSAEEHVEWEARDPLVRFRAYLERMGIWDQDMQDSLEARAKETIDEAVERAETLSDLEPLVLFEHMFEEMPDNLLEQLEYLEDSIATREVEEDADSIRGGFP